MFAPSLSPARGLLAGFLLVATSTGLAATPPWDFKDGDRVVFVGDTFIEREQRYGYVETALTLANADRNVTFRNLGWSADTVRGLSRAGFELEPPEAGFRELVKHVTDSKPTVLVVGYGMAESFDGEAGLPRFVEGYNAFLDAVAPLKARLVLLSPQAHAAMPAPLPDPTAHNRDLKLYADAIRSIAEERGAAFVDVLTPMARRYESMDPAGRATLTDDGIHPNGAGYRALATALLPGADLDAEEVEALRRTIVAKNELFFHRWRPQNITYLFGFRKHEQGRNAVEIPQFDPLVDAKEAEIDALREAIAHEKEMNRKTEAAR
ncbi:SGNH/GDSL hydrolase family protein [Paludisphaera sp.]|uniref:SGNH/GDSL hydrolase family protein n=1 Tax=Paludisphaera sp. TaxID=2017432 RepID=UPI00301BDD95